MPDNIIFTNNPGVLSAYPEISRYFPYPENGVYEIFVRIRDEIHKGAVLISHPLSGSIKPNEGPYKSVVLSIGAGGLDFKSLQLIEDAIGVLKRLPVKVCASAGAIPERILEDFSIIDLDLLNSCAASGLYLGQAAWNRE